MDFTMLFHILQILLYVILGGLALWFRSNDKIKGKTAELINTAESMYTDVTKAGGDRFEWVVDSLYGLLPKPMQAIIPQSMVDDIVQNVFDQMQDFAKKTLDKKVEKVTD